jgi:predicted RND superfamily exporter protein
MTGILAGAATNSAVFFALLFISLPGLAELGLLVGMNVVTGALVMLTFMPHVAVRHRVLDGEQDGSQTGAVTHRYALVGTVLMVAGVATVLLWRGVPAFEGGAAVLRPTHSKATENWDLVQQRLGKANVATVPVVLTFEDAGKAPNVAAEADAVLAKLRQEGLIQGFALPSVFLTHEGYQVANIPGMSWLVKNRQTLEEAVLKEGFTEETLILFRGVVTAWEKSLADAAASTAAHAAMKPAQEAVEVLQRFIGIEPGAGKRSGAGKLVALGFVQMDGQPGSPDPVKLAELNARLSSLPGVRLAAWESLGQALSKRVQQDITREMLPIIAILLVMLALAYRNWRDLLLSVLILALGVAALMATMSLLGKSWNLASLAALPLLLGTGIDYGIHTLLAMKRDGNDIRRMRNTTGRAVFFCGATTVIGFMSLVVADNRGVASLGTACAAGTVWILMLVLWLLPHWRCWVSGRAVQK